MSATTAIGGVRRRAPAGTALPPALAHLSAFAALALFAGLHWFTMAPPRNGGDPRLAVIGLGVLLAAALAFWVPTLSPRARRPVAFGLAIGGSLLGLVVAGLPVKMLLPNHWDELAAGLGRGFDTLPRVNVPYSGLNDWTHLIIKLGGTLLVTLSAAIAFWPGARERARLVALVLLVTLYATPSVEITFGAEYLRGAVLALLVMAFLWLDRVPSAGARIAGVGASLAAVFALALAPVVDGNRPWIDYEKIASSVANGRTVAFTWDHSYGPLTWSREGREVLRVRARRSTYWKAESLEQFDGVVWTSPHVGWQPGEIGEGVTLRRKDIQTVSMLMRGMTSADFVGAGTTLQILDAPAAADALPIGGVGQWRSDRVLRRGDTWRARVYTPDPTAAQLRAAGTGTGVSDRYLTIAVPPASALKDPPPVQGAPVEPEPLATVLFPVLGATGNGSADNGNGGGPLVEPGPDAPAGDHLGRPRDVGELPGVHAQRDGPLGLRARVRALAAPARERHDAPTTTCARCSVTCQRASPTTRSCRATRSRSRASCSPTGAATASSSPAPWRCCCAWAASRRASPPASRPAARTSPPSECVVRDVDAHSWVEAWFPGWGWVPFDPTPSAAPARSQAGTQQSSAAVGDTRDVSKGNDPVDLNGSSGAGLSNDSNGWLLPAVLVGGLLVLLGAVLLRLRRRALEHHPDRLIADLERALRRAGHRVDPSDTLRALERRVAVSSGAVAYLRSIAAARYGGRALRPSGAQRRALRGALGHGLGPAGRLRSWWAVPPRLHR